MEILSAGGRFNQVRLPLTGSRIYHVLSTPLIFKLLGTIDKESTSIFPFLTGINLLRRLEYDEGV
jgi:hypothetical protein